MSYKRLTVYPPVPGTERGSATRLDAQKDKIAYTSGKTVVIRDLNDPAKTIGYTQHTHNATVARISPSGYYCSSADASGSVRIWDLAGDEQILKSEYKVLSGRINDLAWDGESKRIIAVGDGREKFGHAFIFDSGSSTGEISGHSKPINAVSIRHQRPFRAATAGDDGTIIFHQGVPFKYDKTIKTHTKFVQDVRYSASGDHFASVGSDAKAFLYDGKTGDVIGEFEGSEHKGSVMACAWSPNNRSLITAAADCTVKLWDVETRKSITSYTVGSGISAQQVGAVFSGDSPVTLSLDGTLSVFDARLGGVARAIYGPQKAVTAAAAASDSTFLVGTADGRVLRYDTGTHHAEPLGGTSHTNLVSAISTTKGGKAISAGFDDTLREIDGANFVPSQASTSSQPRGATLGENGGVTFAFVAGTSTVDVFRDSQKVHSVSPPFTPSAVATDGTLVAVGGEDSKIHVYSWDGAALGKAGLLEGNKGPITSLAFSPDGTLLASGDSLGKIYLFDVKERKLVTSRWSFHSARVNSLSWTPDSKYCASGSLDSNVYVFSVDKPLKNIAIKNAGIGGVNSVFWLDVSGTKGGRLASTGADSCIRTWEVVFHT